MTYELDQRFAHHMIDLDEVRLHYVRGGDGPPLVLLHGWGSTWYMWRKVMSQLADHYTVIVPDLRGLGDSGVPEKPLTGYDKKTVAQDIHQLVEKLELGLFTSRAMTTAPPSPMHTRQLTATRSAASSSARWRSRASQGTRASSTSWISATSFDCGTCRSTQRATWPKC